MGEPARKRGVAVQDYLAMLDTAQEKLMYWDGEVFSMAGGTLPHDEVEARLVGQLGMVLQGKPCRPFTGNRRLREATSERSVYADASVVCGRSIPHPEDKNATTNPTVVFEVLSPTTEAFDRGDKFAYYRSFSSVQSVVFLSQKEVLVEHFLRSAENVWTLQLLGPGQTLELPSAGCAVAVDMLYLGVELGEPEQIG